LPDIEVYFVPEGFGTRYAEAMGQGQSGVVALALNTVGRAHAEEWQGESGEGWPTFYIPVLPGAGVPPVTIRVAMDAFRQKTYKSRIDFFEYLAELEKALAIETTLWLDSRQGEFRDVGFTFAVAWTLRPSAGSLTDYDRRITTGRYASIYR